MMLRHTGFEAVYAPLLLLVLLFQLVRCALVTVSYVILQASALCGPYYIELSSGNGILHPDIGAHCDFGYSFYFAALFTLLVLLNVTRVLLAVLPTPRSSNDPFILLRQKFALQGVRDEIFRRKRLCLETYRDA